jgi:hypothetical protein
VAHDRAAEPVSIPVRVRDRLSADQALSREPRRPDDLGRLRLPDGRLVPDRQDHALARAGIE